MNTQSHEPDVFQTEWYQWPQATHGFTYLVIWISASYSRGILKLTKLSALFSSELSLLEWTLGNYFENDYWSHLSLIHDFIRRYLKAWKLRDAWFWRFWRLKSKLIMKVTYNQNWNPSIYDDLYSGTNYKDVSQKSKLTPIWSWILYTLSFHLCRISVCMLCFI